MSSADRDAADRTGVPALEHAVARAIEELRAARARAAAAEARCAELEGLLGRFEGGQESPSRMKDQLALLEEENRDLRDRIGRGRESVERLLARIRFLEDQKS